jgi:hypothetical protein
MALPELPKIMERKEAAIQLQLAKKLFTSYPHPNWILEIKMKGCRQKPHQKKVQKQVENGKFLYKFADMGREVPADYICGRDMDYLLCSVDGRNAVCVVNGGVNTFKTKF